MRDRFGPRALLPVAILASLLTRGPEAQAVPSTETAVSMLGASYINQGKPHAFYPGNASITMHGDASFIWVDVDPIDSTQGLWWDFEFAPPAGQALHPGLYTHAQRAVFREPGHPGIDISGDGRGCNNTSGRFDVKDIAFSGGGVTRLWLTWEQNCDGSGPMFGEVRITTPAPPSNLIVAPRILWPPQIEVGGSDMSIPITYFNTTNTAVQLASASVTGLDPQDFPIDSNSCQGVLLSPGKSCQLFVHFEPSSPGPRLATASLKDVRGRTYATALDGFGYGGRTRLVMHSDPGDYIGQGQDWSYDPAQATFTMGGASDRALLSVQAIPERWQAWFETPSGQTLAPGLYPNAQSYAYDPGVYPGIAVSGGGRGCSEYTGWFNVSHVALDPFDGTPTELALAFEQHCDGASAALHGIVEYHNPIGDSIPTGPVTALSLMRSARRTTVQWSNPRDADFSYVVVRYLASTYAPGSPTTGIPAYAGPGTSAVVRGIPSSVPITVAVWAVDSAGNVSPAAVTTA